VKPRRKAGIALAIALAGLADAGRHLVRARPERRRPTDVATARTVSRREAAPPAVTAAPSSRRDAPAPAPARPVRALPRSLRDTDVDGALRVDAEGNLLLGPEVLSLFDYFLTATGEEPAEVIQARIVAAIRERVDARAAEQAIALLGRYLDYRASDRDPRVAPEAEPAARLAMLEELRRDRFGEPAASQLFGSEEREAEVAIEEGRVAADTTLSAEEREARIHEAEATLPDAVREARAEARRPLREQAEEQAMRAAGAMDEEIQAHRVATVGVDAAERLAELDRRRVEWKRRVDGFRDAREGIEATVSDPGRRRAAEEALLGRDFTPEERLRVRAILSLSGG
jgi:lipase chaperone LimK